VALILAALSIAATWLFIFTGERPKNAYYALAVATIAASQGVLLRHGLEWWRGAMLDVLANRQWNPITWTLPILSAVAVFLIASAPRLRKERDERRGVR
jgi:hypothetical protein